MSPARVLDTLETDRLILRPSTVDEAAIYRQLWTERDPRVPPHRRINSDGRPAVEDIAAQIRAARAEPGPGLLAVERKGTVDVIGYCGLTIHGNGSPDEPELAYELLRAAHGCGYATEAGRAVGHMGERGGLPTVVGRGLGLERRVATGSWRSSGSAKWAGRSPALSTATAC
jgi:RimJ/RimL family protein N-acetyltransferase